MVTRVIPYLPPPLSTFLQNRNILVLLITYIWKKIAEIMWNKQNQLDIFEQFNKF